MMRITIRGPVAVGKTTVGDIIEQALKEKGYTIERLLEPARHRPRSDYMHIQMEETNCAPFN
jgi:nucleoside-triphosphatase THEP1